MMALGFADPRLFAQKEGQVFLKLTGADGKPVTDLQLGDVTINEDGVECKVTKVEAVNWPVKLHVLVDNGRVNTEPINSLREGLKGLFDQMPDGVEMSLYATAGTPRSVVKATTDKQKLLDGISLIAPDGGAGAFFDALSEAANRIDKDKTPGFPVIVMVGSDVGKVNALDRNYSKLQDVIIAHGITVYISVTASHSGVGSSGGVAQTEIGLNVTKLSGGTYENLNSTTRLATLLPEWGKKIAESHERQKNQYRVTYERPAKPAAQARIGVSVKREAAVSMSLDGRVR
jgi:hypothetical protein